MDIAVTEKSYLGREAGSSTQDLQSCRMIPLILGHVKEEETKIHMSQKRQKDDLSVQGSPNLPWQASNLPLRTYGPLNKTTRAMLFASRRWTEGLRTSFKGLKRLLSDFPQNKILCKVTFFML